MQIVERTEADGRAAERERKIETNIDESLPMPSCESVSRERKSHRRRDHAAAAPSAREKEWQIS